MSENIDYQIVVDTVYGLLKAEGKIELYELLSSAKVSITDSTYDNWNGGTNYHTIGLGVETSKFVMISSRLEELENFFLDKFEISIRHIPNEYINKVSIYPNRKPEDPQLEICVDISNNQRIIQSVSLIKKNIREAKTIDQYQAIGMLCRELLITIAQDIYIKEKHQPKDVNEISPTDAKAMFSAIASYELRGSSQEVLRKYFKSTIDLANELTHKRTANKKQAKLAATATIALLNIIYEIIEQE